MINQKPFYGYAQGRTDSPVETDCKCGFCRAGATFDFSSQVVSWIRQLAGATGAELAIFIADKAYLKTRQQEKGLHAMYQPLSKEKGWSMADIKRYFLGEVFGYTKSMIDGSIVLVEPHTSDLNKAQYSELIERSLDIAADKFEFYLEAPSEWTERKEKERKKLANAGERRRAA